MTDECLPPEVERLLLDVVADGFTVYCCGPKAKPAALVAAYEWPQCIDLITIRDFDRITAARMTKRGNTDIFAPEVVMCAYEGPPQWTLRMLLNLVHPLHPLHPDAPHGEYSAPPCLHIPRAEQRPMTIDCLYPTGPVRELDVRRSACVPASPLPLPVLTNGEPV